MLQAASSFECDGCGHHASYHALENPAEDKILQKWSEQEAEVKQQQAAVGASKKRKLITQREAVADEDRITILDEAPIEPGLRAFKRA
jgi:MinD superfamily P-loop ATPase